MTGNIYILVGAICGVISIVAIPYGFHLKGQENSKVVTPSLSKQATDQPSPVDRGKEMPANKEQSSILARLNTMLATADGLSLSIDRDKEYKRIIDVAIKSQQYSFGLSTISKLSLSIDRDRALKDLYSAALTTHDFDFAKNAISKLSLSIDRDKANREMLDVLSK